jgi:hypothetical protein
MPLAPHVRAGRGFAKPAVGDMRMAVWDRRLILKNVCDRRGHRT